MLRNQKGGSPSQPAWAGPLSSRNLNDYIETVDCFVLLLTWLHNQSSLSPQKGRRRCVARFSGRTASKKTKTLSVWGVNGLVLLLVLIKSTWPTCSDPSLRVSHRWLMSLAYLLGLVCRQRVTLWYLRWGLQPVQMLIQPKVSGQSIKQKEKLLLQTFGSGNLLRVGVILQRSIFILLLTCFPCWALLVNTELILLLVRQEPEVARLAHMLPFFIFEMYFSMMGFNFFFFCPVTQSGWLSCMWRSSCRFFRWVFWEALGDCFCSGLLRSACVLDMSEFENEILKGKILDLLSWNWGKKKKKRFRWAVVMSR